MSILIHSLNPSHLESGGASSFPSVDSTRACNQSLAVRTPETRQSTSRAMAQTVVLRVGMSCEGCVGAVKRVLGKMEGVESFDVDIKEQKVTVKGNITPEAVLQTVSKTGKKTSLWEAEPASNQSKTPADATATAS